MWKESAFHINMGLEEESTYIHYVAVPISIFLKNKKRKKTEDVLLQFRGNQLEQFYEVSKMFHFHGKVKEILVTCIYKQENRK